MDSLLIVDQSKKYSTTRWTIYCGLLCPMQMCPGLHWGSQTETGDDWRRSGHLREKDERQVSLSGTCMGQLPPHPLGVDIDDGPFKWHPKRSASNKIENWWLECVMRKHKGRNKPHWSLTSNDMYACMAISSGPCSHFPLSPQSIQLKSPRKVFDFELVTENLFTNSLRMIHLLATGNLRPFQPGLAVPCNYVVHMLF